MFYQLPYSTLLFLLVFAACLFLLPLLNLGVFFSCTLFAPNDPYAGKISYGSLEQLHSPYKSFFLVLLTDNGKNLHTKEKKNQQPWDNPFDVLLPAFRTQWGLRESTGWKNSQPWVSPSLWWGGTSGSRSHFQRLQKWGMSNARRKRGLFSERSGAEVLSKYYQFLLHSLSKAALMQ